jgi:hypothetical protein
MKPTFTKAGWLSRSLRIATNDIGHPRSKVNTNLCATGRGTLRAHPFQRTKPSIASYSGRPSSS